MIRTRLVCTLVFGCLVLSAPTRAQEVTHPPAVTPSGSSGVPLAARATRTHLLGLVELYSIALYVESPSDRTHLLSMDTPKALRIEVIYEDDFRQRIALDWREELIPGLEPVASAHLRGTFASLRRGDTVLIEYAPARGATVRVNRAVAVSGAHHDLMVAFLDHWLGQRPVSEEIKRILLEP